MKVLALHDPPCSKSLAMVAFMVRPDSGDEILVYGFKEWPKLISEGEFKLLCEMGSALDVSASNVFLTPPAVNLAAGFLGDDFVINAQKINAPMPVVPSERHAIPERGAFWIAPVKEVYECLFNWTQEAARRVFRERSKPLADLMHWALPCAIETQAATWFTKETKQEKEKLLAFRMQVFPRIASNRKELERLYEQTAKRYLKGG